jgi:hypothetical protein
LDKSAKVCRMLLDPWGFAGNGRVDRYGPDVRRAD